MLGLRRRPNDDDLLSAAAALVPSVDYPTLTRERLAIISQRFGCDFATALFYDRLRRHPANATFIAEVDAFRRAPDEPPPPGSTILIAPAAFYSELPRFGGDGDLIREVATRLGWRCELLPTESRGSVRRNAALVRDALERVTDGPALVVSLSKGAADVRLALESFDRTPASLRGWVQICGLVRGSPVIDAILDNPFRRTFLRAYLSYLHADLSVCSELTWRDNALLGGPIRVPEGLDVVSVVGFPRSTHLRGNVRRRYKELRRFGPNDGSTLLRDAIVEPGNVYPVWGADHYFRVPDVPEIVAALLRFFAARWRA
jgi:hypothetical protein